jgi:hypothetical protein
MTYLITTISQETLVADHPLQESPSTTRPFHPSSAVVHRRKLHFLVGLVYHLRQRRLIRDQTFRFFWSESSGQMGS